MTDSARLYVADDGCGNRYFINSNDTKPLVFLDSHDPPRIEETGLTLDEFFSTKLLPTLHVVSRNAPTA
jgi:hypothetical protein